MDNLEALKVKDKLVHEESPSLKKTVVALEVEGSSKNLLAQQNKLSRQVYFREAKSPLERDWKVL